MFPNVASQMRTAFASMVSKTGFNSPGELEMTCSTSEVAVCCSKRLGQLTGAGFELLFQIASVRLELRY